MSYKTYFMLLILEIAERIYCDSSSSYFSICFLEYINFKWFWIIKILIIFMSCMGDYKLLKDIKHYRKMDYNSHFEFRLILANDAQPITPMILVIIFLRWYNNYIMEHMPWYDYETLFTWRPQCCWKEGLRTLHEIMRV